MAKKALSLLPHVGIFIFCVVFVSGYNHFFGIENTVIGIEILTALFIFLKSSLGYNAKQAAICLPIALVISIVSPKLSTFNPYLGILINFASIFAILVLTSFDVKADNHVPFLLGYVFAIGYDVSGIAFEKRLLSIIIFGLIIAVIYYLKNKNTESDYNLKHVIKHLNINSTDTQWYIKLATVLTLVMFLGDIFNYPNTMWIGFAVLSLTYHQRDIQISRIKARIPATILGGVIFFIIFCYVIPPEHYQDFVMILGFFMMFMKNYFKKSVANAITAMAASIFIFSSTGVIFIRVISNIIGVIIAIANQKIFDKVFEKRALSLPSPE